MNKAMRQRQNNRKQGGKSSPAAPKMRDRDVYEISVPLFPIGYSKCGPRIDAEDPEWCIFQNGTVAELLIRDPSQITFMPVFPPLVQGMTPVLLFEAVCMPNSKESESKGQPVCSIMPSIYTKEGPKMVIERPQLLTLAGYTRIRFPLHPSQMLQGLAMRCGLTITPMGDHNVRLVAAALGMVRPENL